MEIKGLIKKPKIIKKRINGHPILEIEKIKVTTLKARELARLVEQHYLSAPKTGHIYQPPKDERASFFDDEEGSPTYKCKRYSIRINTSEGVLNAEIDSKSRLNMTCQGNEEFVDAFFKLLNSISRS